ncbi:hypothetical protein Tsp_08162 [Trichinella spiralis]|uniref:hypothetical protein n=1 Tax=Trichinella spiralis TaxID=6334 RepID=UPI0001EFE693|nr:hypothetical protein Tsp_08162 [Trichinella spiralis]
MISASNSNAPRTMVHLESIVSTDVFRRSSASVHTHGVRDTQFIATQTISKTQMHTHIQTNKQNHSNQPSAQQRVPNTVSSLIFRHKLVYGKTVQIQQQQERQFHVLSHKNQRIHEVAWSLAYRRHNSELPAESSTIDATISGIHVQGCIYEYGQPHQHIDLMPVSSIRRSE